MNDDQRRPSALPDAPALLRDAAQAHRPDRERMLARVERELDADARRPRRRFGAVSWWPKAVLAAGATLGVAVAGGLAVAAIGQTPAPRPVRTELAPGTPSPAPDPASPSPTAPTGPQSPRTGIDGRPSVPPPSSSASSAPPAPPRSAPPAASSPSSRSSDRSLPFAPVGAGAQDGPVWSDGTVDPNSNGYWQQNNLTVTTHEPLTALTVELRVALTPGVSDAGHWQNRSDGDFAFSVRAEAGDLVYRWTLRPGIALPPGPYVFAAQFNHAPGQRDPEGDEYRADATAPSAHPSVWGSFDPTS